MSDMWHVNCIFRVFAQWAQNVLVDSNILMITAFRIDIKPTLPSPKPDLPGPSAYAPPSPLSHRKLGPPPPGYGQYADYDRPFPQAGLPGQTGRPWGAPGQQNLDEVVCFKCGKSKFIYSPLFFS